MALCYVTTPCYSLSRSIGVDPRREGADVLLLLLSWSFEFRVRGWPGAWLLLAAVLRSFVALVLYLETKESGKVSHPPGTLLFARLSPREVSRPKFWDILLVDY